jgi:response regulator of citrate/malate metabolism
MSRDRVLDTLVVDDDYRVASVHAGFVEKVPGFRVVGEAHTAAEAIKLAQAHRPDLVLMDIYLPDGDGLQVARSLLDAPDSPIVMVVSAANDLAAIRGALQVGVVQYLVKPFTFATLAERLGAIRAAQSRLADWPEQANQADVDRMFALFRPAATDDSPAELARLAPTLRSVYDALAASDSGMSAAEVALDVGISRATAQRYLSQLEHTGTVRLDLRYGGTGRPEHRYTIIKRRR